jgi:2-keto-4-pentenoate hydratase/2-oxohepta-3-ene-1,7-dioic acid hydratase in catechol pathway
MKLLRMGAKGSERPAILDAAGQARDISGYVDDIAGAVLGQESLAKLAGLDLAGLPMIPAGTRIGPCVGRVGKFIGVGLNYADHAAETGATPPVEPILFMKATSSICGPNDAVIIPKDAMKTDWEVELGIVIGTHASYVDESKAMTHVAGFCVVNDISERAFQLEGTGQWLKGKSADTFGPIGPWLVTADEIIDPQNIGLRLSVNGQMMQNGTTKTMIFGVAHLVAYISRFMSLQPGDVITTGTPPGVGAAQKPPLFLTTGDQMTLSIDGLGEQTQTCVGHQSLGAYTMSQLTNPDRKGK